MMISYRYPQLLFVAILVGWEEEANSVGVFPALQALVLIAVECTISQRRLQGLIESTIEYGAPA